MRRCIFLRKRKVGGSMVEHQPGLLVSLVRFPAGTFAIFFPFCQRFTSKLLFPFSFPFLFSFPLPFLSSSFPFPSPSDLSNVRLLTKNKKPVTPFFVSTGPSTLTSSKQFRRMCFRVSLNYAHCMSLTTHTVCHELHTLYVMNYTHCMS